METLLAWCFCSFTYVPKSKIYLKINKMINSSEPRSIQFNPIELYWNSKLSYSSVKDGKYCSLLFLSSCGHPSVSGAIHLSVCPSIHPSKIHILRLACLSCSGDTEFTERYSTCPQICLKYNQERGTNTLCIGRCYCQCVGPVALTVGVLLCSSQVC